MGKFVASFQDQGSAKTDSTNSPPKQAGRRQKTEEQQWQIITEAVEDLHLGPDVRTATARWTFEPIYRACYKFVLQKKENEVINKIVHIHTDLLWKKTLPRLQEQASALESNLSVSQSGDEAQSDFALDKRAQVELGFLRALQDGWNEHKELLPVMEDMFQYACDAIEKNGRGFALSCDNAFRDRLLDGELEVADARLETGFKVSAFVVPDMVNDNRPSEIAADQKSVLGWAIDFVQDHRSSSAEGGEAWDGARWKSLLGEVDSAAEEGTGGSGVDAQKSE